ncbi:Aldehyde/histidinol dehydrogenase [Kockovaella imperatae]|uniref:Aldehyde dehydrogenase n=1 Tax=Kockovaella imperatae TaxID=4999 RepID=A0A1Y1UTC2_9TREE|nr:Aldehyde/histidinol dehydrogenase [Kockovaella imperatae]ORX40867.1 Aldehyde/histidinol dehydrogenase [Kockovaella imperatae]
MADESHDTSITETSLEQIDKLYAKHQQKFKSRATIPVEWRIYNLKQLWWMIKDNEAAIQAASKEDLDTGPLACSISDLWPVYNEIALAIRRLPTWVKPEVRWWDSQLAFKFMCPTIRKQPKGVCLIISPWNYPWQLSLVPLVHAIAAGCPVMLKPSEHSPACSALLAKLLPQYLDSGAYSVVLGGPQQAAHLLEKSWGHILFTGSGRIGSMVATAAAKTLTPMTLELGGKSPVIVSKCADLRKIARRIFSIKQLTCGQMCVTPDYILCDREVVKEFVEECKQTLEHFFPPAPSEQSMLKQPFTSRLRTKESYDRMQSFMEQADSAGRLAYKGEANAGSLRMGFSLVLLNEDGVGETGPLIEEEIFGPVLPIIPYSSLDTAIEYINNGPDPLAIYVCSSKRSVFKRVCEETMSGSCTWNDFAFSTFARSLPFGGVGASGYGAYHGEDGFKTFTHQKSTLEIPLYFEPLMSLRYPPITAFGQTVLTSLLLTGSSFNRPRSVRDERIRWYQGLPWMYIVGVAFACVFAVLVNLDNIQARTGMRAQTLNI